MDTNNISTLIESIKKIEETPYLHVQDSMPDSIFHLKGDYSPEALDREFLYQFTISTDSENIDFMLQKSLSCLIGVSSDWRTSKERIPTLFKMSFAEKSLLNVIPSEIRDRKILQLYRAKLKNDLRNNSIAYTVFRRLTDRGYALVSDNAQFESAKWLWIKLAKNSDSVYKVIVTDVDNGTFKDEDENTIMYNGYNIDDRFIWTTGSDFKGQYVVLILY